MLKLTIGGNEYCIEYGFNSFADTDLLERVEEISALLSGAETDSDVSAIGRVRDLFVIVRELVYVGFEKHNPVDNIREIGDLLDIYRSESTGEDDNRGLLDIFVMLSNELTDEGFLKDFLNQAMAEQKVTKIPQDHKKATTKKA